MEEFGYKNLLSLNNTTTLLVSVQIVLIKVDCMRENHKQLLVI